MNTNNNSNIQSNQVVESKINEQSETMISFISKVKSTFPIERLDLEPEKNYGYCTTGEKRKIVAGIKVIDSTEIKLLFQLANEFDVPLYPISSGKNWGYGTALPVENFCAIVDLSLMNKIIEVNAKMGWVKLQPGVTQLQLRKYLDENSLNFMVPTTGAGPHVSILGNALERGYGITPHKDHFDAVINLEAILPNGETYHSVMKELGGQEIHNNFKWGIGPHLDQLFSQSNFGIVTEATVSLCPKPEQVEVFVFELNSDKELPQAVEAIRTISQKYGNFISGMNLMNQRRVISMKLKYPQHLLKKGELVLDDKVVEQVGLKHKIPKWTGVGAIYGTKGVANAIKTDLKKILSFAHKVKFINTKYVKTIDKIASVIPSFLGGDNIRSLSSSLKSLTDILEGRPSEVALPLAYWRSSDQYNSLSSQNLAKDQCGLIWYSPLVTMEETKINSYIHFVESTCKLFGVEPLITLTSISDKCFDSTVPILFDKKDLAQKINSEQCYQELFNIGQKIGYFPYRVGVNAMEKITSVKAPGWELVSQIKKAIDPNNILAPGRYSRS